MQNIYFILMIYFLLILSGCYVESTEAELLTPGSCLQQDKTDINCLPDHPIYGVKSAGKGIGVKIDNLSDNLIVHNYFDNIILNKDGTIRRISNIFFKEINCQGEPYIFYDESGDNFKFPQLKGKLIPYQNQLFYYKPAENMVYQFNSLSHLEGSCLNSNYQALFFKLVPNDPAVTGIEIYPFPTPITIDAPQMNIITE